VGVWPNVDGSRCGSAPFPSLSKEGQARSAGVVCSKTRSHLMDARGALLINRCASRASIRSVLRTDFEQTTPSAPAAQPPLLTKEGTTSCPKTLA
jgi:hypothetical protein